MDCATMADEPEAVGVGFAIRQSSKWDIQG
jgi:hypothetical protein